ncbi:hypothetical protein B481_2827 [Planococcus halocryophilus Or1]|uniref:DUF4139 domain-containing protein n=1 Tax=Planococcus halocryophilus TaxID=1215089 RepID=A0A1C7DU45_9BACL|nr:hypothetical protein [Planococcus halocryophilus]ANU14922.1 DUF4139 domain-containing protein [Planococcus halocryophilus]EMF45594.1 hypothetical protein B481_2827 [Planococcus halocryophilus Or1]
MEFQSTHEHLLSQSITIYNDGFGLVKEMREVPANKEVTEIRFMNVSPKIEVDSILIEGLHIVEQSYTSDLVSKETLLEKYIDEIITIKNEKLNKAWEVRLLSVSDHIIAERMDTGEILIDPVGQLIFPGLPKELLTKPALVCKVMAIESASKVDISYLTEGVEWRANYVAKISGSTLNFIGWFQISNNSGMIFSESQLQLAAGKVNRYKNNLPLVTQSSLFSAAEEPKFGIKEHSLADSYVYSMGRPVTILNKQTKQISFLNIQEVAFRRLYKIDAHSEQAKVVVEFDNIAANKLGMPLPQGVLKVYHQDDNGEMEFIGEDAVKNTAVQQKVSLTVGRAFDIVSESWEKKRDRSGHFDYITYIYKVHNQKSAHVRVDVKHEVFEQMWEMESSSHDYELKQSNELEFCVHMSPGKKVEVEFTYKVNRRTEE